MVVWLLRGEDGGGVTVTWRGWWWHGMMAVVLRQSGDVNSITITIKYPL